MSIDFIAPKTRTLDIEGTAVTVQPFRVGQLPMLMGLARPVLSGLPELMRAYETVAAAARTEGGEPDALALGAGLMPIVMLLIEQHGEAVIEIVALATGVDTQWLQDLHFDRFAAIAAAVLEVNVDFFSRAMPLLRSLGAQVKDAQATA